MANTSPFSTRYPGEVCRPISMASGYSADGKSLLHATFTDRMSSASQVRLIFALKAMMKLELSAADSSTARTADNGFCSLTQSGADMLNPEP